MCGKRKEERLGKSCDANVKLNHLQQNYFLRLLSSCFGEYRLFNRSFMKRLPASYGERQYSCTKEGKERKNASNFFYCFGQPRDCDRKKRGRLCRLSLQTQNRKKKRHQISAAFFCSVPFCPLVFPLPSHLNPRYRLWIFLLVSFPFPLPFSLCFANRKSSNRACNLAWE